MQGTFVFSEKEDALKFMLDHNIKVLNLCHVPEDGRLRTLSFSTTNKDRIAEVLDFGERVDGSSLFSSIEPGKSDIYVMPKIRRTYVNPFSTLPTINMMCNYVDEDGRAFEMAPQNALERTLKNLRSRGIMLKALAELEFYVIAQLETKNFFQAEPERNYHESTPYTKFEDIRNEALTTLEVMGIPTKYGHCEVGRILGQNNILMEQHEIELSPQELSETAENIAIAKWSIRNICARHGVTVSFIPKINLAHAGTGMHIHICAIREGQNIIADADKSLSKEALAMIGGILKLAPSLSAFGNPTPISYLRFFACKESPMHICWSSRNRLALIRIPLWWNFTKRIWNMDKCQETFEYRAPDAFANAHLLLAGLAVAAGYGLENSQEAIKTAEDLHVESPSNKPLQALPRSCSETAENLKKQRSFYEANAIFPKKLIDNVLQKLETYGDRNLRRELSTNPERFESLVTQYMHYG